MDTVLNNMMLDTQYQLKRKRDTLYIDLRKSYVFPHYGGILIHIFNYIRICDLIVRHINLFPVGGKIPGSPSIRRISFMNS